MQSWGYHALIEGAMIICKSEQFYFLLLILARLDFENHQNDRMV